MCEKRGERAGVDKSRTEGWLRGDGGRNGTVGGKYLDVVASTGVA